MNNRMLRIINLLPDTHYCYSLDKWFVCLINIKKIDILIELVIIAVIALVKHVA